MFGCKTNKMLFSICLATFSLLLTNGHVYNPRLEQLKTLRSQAIRLRQNLAELSRRKFDNVARDSDRCPKVVCKDDNIPVECRLKTYFIRNGVKCRGCDNNKCSKRVSDLLRGKINDLELAAKPSVKTILKNDKTDVVRPVAKPVEPIAKRKLEVIHSNVKINGVPKKSDPMITKIAKPQEQDIKPMPKLSNVAHNPDFIEFKPPKAVDRPNVVQKKPMPVFPVLTDLKQIKVPKSEDLSARKIIKSDPIVVPNKDAVDQIKETNFDSLFTRLSKVANLITEKEEQKQAEISVKQTKEKPVSEIVVEIPAEEITRKLEKVVDKLLSIPMDRLVDNTKEKAPSKPMVEPIGPVLPPVETVGPMIPPEGPIGPPPNLRRAPPRPRGIDQDPLMFVDGPLVDRFGFDQHNPNLFMPLPDTQIESFAAFAPIDPALPLAQQNGPLSSPRDPQTQQVIDELRSQNSAMQQQLQRISNQLQGQQAPPQMGGQMPFPMMPNPALGADGMPFMGQNPMMGPGGMAAMEQNTPMIPNNNNNGMANMGQNMNMGLNGFPNMGQNFDFGNGQFPAPNGNQNFQGAPNANLQSPQQMAGNSWSQFGQQNQGPMQPFPQFPMGDSNFMGNTAMNNGNNWAGPQSGNMMGQQAMNTNTWATVPIQNAMPNQVGMGGNAFNQAPLGGGNFNQNALDGNPWSVVGFQQQVPNEWGNAPGNSNQNTNQNPVDAAMLNHARNVDGSANSIHGLVG